VVSKTVNRDKLLRPLAAERRRQQQNGPLGVNRSARGVEVRPHPCRIDLEPSNHLGQGRHRRAGRLHDGADDRPLGLDAPDAALVLLRHGGQV
jgi:hypothetical protein